MTENRTDLAQRKCVPCEGGVRPMNDTEIAAMLKRLDGWTYADGVISRSFAFEDYYETSAFVNAVAWIAHREDHHPDITFGYKTCRVSFVTHAIGGLSENDFIAAAKVNALVSS